MDYKAPIPTHDYKVLIECYTYNQEHYIEDALNGYVRQRTNFPFCVIVVDDCSTDRNVEIIKQYEQRYPDIIKGIYLPVNMFGNPKKKEFVKPWEKRSQYLAVCDGDDYWIDDNKLQRQVDFLDSHPDYMMHFHNAIVRFDNHREPDYIISNFKSGDFDTARIFMTWQLPLASILFRQTLLESTEYKVLSQEIRGGFLFFITASKLGKIFGLSECLSVYRKSDSGVSNQMSVAYCEQLLFNYAKATGDAASINYRKNSTTSTLSRYMPKLLKGDKDAKELLQVAREIDKMIPVKAFFKWIIRMPINLLRSIIKR